MPLLPETAIRPGRFDKAEVRQSVRKGRERGCWVYIAGELLADAGIDPHAAPPRYRMSASNNRNRKVFVSLYPATA